MNDPRVNLARLAEYLEGLPADYAHFEMADFILEPKREELHRYALKNGGVQSCGTAACAVGHGPAAGIYVPEKFLRETGVNWTLYTYEFFVPDDSGSNSSVVFNYLFGGNWTYVDNTHRGAAARIRYFLDHGVPAYHNDDDEDQEGFEHPTEDDVAVYAHLLVP